MKYFYDAVLIIPNEKKTNGKVYFEKLKEGEHHYDKEVNFVKKYNITNLPGKGQLKFEIAHLGHIILEIDGKEKRLIFYLPETVTKRQRKIINKLEIKYIIKRFVYDGFIGGYIINVEKHMIREVEGYDEIMDFINQSVEDIEEKQNFKR